MSDSVKTYYEEKEFGKVEAVKTSSTVEAFETEYPELSERI